MYAHKHFSRKRDSIFIDPQRKIRYPKIWGTLIERVNGVFSFCFT